MDDYNCSASRSQIIENWSDAMMWNQAFNALVPVACHFLRYDVLQEHPLLISTLCEETSVSLGRFGHSFLLTSLLLKLMALKTWHCVMVSIAEFVSVGDQAGEWKLCMHQAFWCVCAWVYCKNLSESRTVGIPAAICWNMCLQDKICRAPEITSYTRKMWENNRPFIFKFTP